MFLRSQLQCMLLYCNSEESGEGGTLSKESFLLSLIIDLPERLVNIYRGNRDNCEQSPAYHAQIPSEVKVT